MLRKVYMPEEITGILRHVEVLIAKGRNVADAVRQIGINEITYYRWRHEFGGLSVDQYRRLKELEHENARLRRALAALAQGNRVLSEGFGERDKMASAGLSK